MTPKNTTASYISDWIKSAVLNVFSGAYHLRNCLKNCISKLNCRLDVIVNTTTGEATNTKNSLVPVYVL